jgi:hypothetical protein
MTVGNVSLSTCFVPFKNIGGSPNTEPVTTRNGLTGGGLTMKQPVPLCLAISGDSTFGQNRGNPHAKTKIITLESNGTIRFWRLFYKKMKIITVEIW